MAYNGYGNGGYGQGGYGQSNPYQNNANSNPYAAQQQNPYNNPPSYDRPAGQGQNMEMQPMVNGQQNPFDDPNNRYGTPGSNRHAILNECQEVQRAIDDLEKELSQLQRAQRGFVSGTGASNRDIDAMSAEIMSGYRAMADRVRRIKSRPEAGQTQNAPQVNALDRRIKKAINQFQQQESAFRHDVQEQQKRQYLIVNPNATEAELREVSEAGGDVQIFQQALMQSDRRGQAQTALGNVRQRHDAIQQIEKTMMELAQLFQDLDAMVVEQEPMIEQAEKKADDTRVHMESGVVELGGAVNSARAARRKKWYCLGISILILIIVIAIVLGYGASQGWFNSNKNN